MSQWLFTVDEQAHIQRRQCRWPLASGRALSSVDMKVKLKLPNASSPGRVVVSPPHKKAKKRRRDENGRQHKKLKKHHRDDTERKAPEGCNAAAPVDVPVLSDVPPPPPPPPKPNYSDMQRVIDHLQKHDKADIFKDPVTDDVAPGYSSVVTHPMDFTTIRKKFTAREYDSWQALLDDMMLMFDNSMKYNPADTIYYKQSKTLKEVAKKLVELGQRGVTNFRGKTAQVVRAHNAQVAADERAEKNAMKAAVRAQRLQMKNDKLLQKAAANGILLPAAGTVPNLRNATKWNLAAATLNADGRRPLLPEEHTRATYRPLLSLKSLSAAWGGLLSGRNADGVAFVGHALHMVPRYGRVTHAMYKNSAEQFTSKLQGRARDYIMQKMGLKS